MKIEKTPSAEGITLKSKSLVNQTIYFDTEQERDIVFAHWCEALLEIEASKAIYRPVYEDADGETRILKLRYTTQQEVIEVDKAHKLHFPDGMKLVMIYNEQERSFINVNN